MMNCMIILIFHHFGNYIFLASLITIPYHKTNYKKKTKPVDFERIISVSIDATSIFNLIGSKLLVFKHRVFVKKNTSTSRPKVE